MIGPWLAAGALAQTATDNVFQCTTDDALPIAGSAGFANALDALRTNAQTYSASSFLERTGLRQVALSDAPSVLTAQMDMNLAFGAARVPVYQDDAGYDGCPAAYRLGERPVDLHAYNLAIAGRKGRFGAFYSASMTMGYLADSIVLRPAQAAGTFVLAPMLLTTAPVLGSWQTQQGASAFALDWVGGVVIDAELASIRGGYTRSRGFYLSAQDAKVGALFGTVVLRDGLRAVGQLRGGVERLPLPAQVEAIGRPSAFVRVLPLTDLVDPRDAVAEVPAVNLTTGHLEQHDIGSMVDVAFGYAVRPSPQVYNLSIAVHDAAFWDLGDGGSGTGIGQDRLRFRAEAGFVDILPQSYYGVEGGLAPHLRIEVASGMPAGFSGKGSRVAATALYNDPEQTALFPYAVNTLSLHVEIRGAM